MDFTPESEDEVIRESISYKLYIIIVNPPNKVWRDSTQNKYPTPYFHIGDHLIYTNEGHNEMVEMLDVNKNDSCIIKYIINLFIGNKMVVTKDFPKSRNVPDIVSIKSY